MKKITLQEWINKFHKVHSNKYSYSKVTEVKNNRIPICIICPEHGEFWQNADNHSRGQDCPKCGIKKASQSKTYDTDDFIKLAKQKHPNLQYDYSSVNYISSDIKVKIFCIKCNKFFFQKPKKHLQGDGCPNCIMSKGERKIEQWLKNKSIRFIPQMTFDKCRGIKKPLPFDFYLSDYNTCIEFDGKQHFELSFSFDNEKRFQRTKINDEIKNQFCKENGINLIRISYKDNIILALENQISKSEPCAMNPYPKPSVLAFSTHSAFIIPSAMILIILSW